MNTEIYKKGDSIMKKIYDALDIIKEYIGAEVYEICLLGKESNDCMGDHCKNCRNIWKTRLSYNNLSEIFHQRGSKKDIGRRWNQNL